MRPLVSFTHNVKNIKSAINETVTSTLRVNKALQSIRQHFAFAFVSFGVNGPLRWWILHFLWFGHTELTKILSVSDIGNKWLGNPFKNQSAQCGHFCIFLCKANLSVTKSDLERISASSVWPSR